MPKCRTRPAARAADMKLRTWRSTRCTSGSPGCGDRGRSNRGGRRNRCRTSRGGGFSTAIAFAPTGMPGVIGLVHLRISKFGGQPAVFRIWGSRQFQKIASPVSGASRTTRRTGRQTKPRTPRSRPQSPGPRQASRRSRSRCSDRSTPAGQGDGLADGRNHKDRPVLRQIIRRVFVAISESGPWRQCGMRCPSTERPKFAPRYAAAPTFTWVANGSDPAHGKP